MTYDSLASKGSIERTIAALPGRGVEPILVSSAAEALEKIKELIPAGVSVMNGASVTLEQIGFVDCLKEGKHPWNNLHAGIVAEKDGVKQAELRRQALLSEYYLGSVHALAETGEFIVASNTASQLPHVVFSSPNLIFVVSTKKIVPTLAEAAERLEKYVVPLEDKHMHELYGGGTELNKIVVWKGESSLSKRKVRMILIQEPLGF